MSAMTAAGRALGAVLVLVAIVVAPPVLLVGYIGNPWPAEGLDLTAPLTDAALIAAMAAICWVLWAQLVACVVVEAVAAVRGARLPTRVPGTLAVQQQLVRGLVAAVIAVAVSAPIVNGSLDAAVAATPAATATSSQLEQRVTQLEGGPRNQAPMVEHSENRQRREVTVRRGDTLWALAAAYLGAGERWTEIAELNTGRTMVDGGVFRSADMILPGWELRLPPDAVGLPERTEGAQPPDDGARTVSVRRGDTLSQIAQQHLGDSNRWDEVFTASQRIAQPRGQRLVDPDVIQPGWTVVVPSQALAELPDADRPGHANHRRDGHPPDHLENRGTHDERPPLPEERPNGLSSAPPTQQEPATDGPRFGEADTAGGAESVDDDAPPSWLLAGLAGGGAILAGSMLLTMRRNRRAQFRVRRPGRTIPTPAPDLVPTEKSLTVAGGPVAPKLEWVDDTLRRWASQVTAAGKHMPALAAVELTPTTVVMHLAQPCDLHIPWRGSEDRRRWACDLGTSPDEIGGRVEGQPAPYPLLTTIGAADSGNVWLLNCEQPGLINLTGDAAASRDFARYVAAEMACNPWSNASAVDLVGIGDEIVLMAPDRIHHHTRVDRISAEALADAVATIDATERVREGAATARAGQLGGDAWGSRLMVLEVTTESPQAAADGSFSRLARVALDHAGRTGLAVMVVGDANEPTGWVLHHSGDGRVHVKDLGLDLAAVGLSREEAQGCAALLAVGSDLGDEVIPVDEDAEQGWRSYSDNAGALRSEHTVRRGTPHDSEPEPLSSVLVGSDEGYVAATATTLDDLQALAPQVPAGVRSTVEAADPGLDEDVRAWFSERCDLPRLTLLGPVGVRAHGAALVGRRAYFTELLAFLALRPYGATPEEVAAAFSIEVVKARNYVKTVRDWLGINPRTGTRHLPDATKSPAGRARGIGVYQVEGLLVDADLFRRLRVRGQARGTAGMADLRRALMLVAGRPFDQLRPGGWAWLADGDRIDEHMKCAIVDVAHLVTTGSLSEGNLRDARAAAEIAAHAVPDEEVPRLDLAAVTAAEGHEPEARRILRQDICDRTDDDGPPMELSERTRLILSSHQWPISDKSAS